MSSTGILRASGLTRSFGALTAVADVSLTIAAGEWLALTGPSGSGKTTLMQMLGLLDRPSKGAIRFGDLDPWQGTATLRSGLRLEKLGFVFQDNNLLEHLSARENVALPAWRLLGRRNAALSAADALLERLGLASLAGAKAKVLSTGEAQRVAIARALINRPELILADEPTGNLDRVSAELVLAAFQDVRAAGSALLLVTHDEGVAARADRILRMSGGRLSAA